MTTVLRESTPRARKPYHCSLCGVKINAGQRYNVVVTVDDYGGNFRSWRHCLHCADLLRMIWATAPHDYYDDTGVGPDEADEWARQMHDDPGVLGANATAYLIRRGITLGG